MPAEIWLLIHKKVCLCLNCLAKLLIIQRPSINPIPNRRYLQSR